MTGKTLAAAAIERARAELDEALDRLAELPVFDSDRLTYAAHALNNYLMVVATTVHLLTVTLSKRADVETRDKLEALNHATGLMRQLVRQLVLPGDERPNLFFSPVDLAKVVGYACDEYEPIAAEKKICLVRKISSEAVMVWTDRVAIGAVLDNLMSNAVKYSAQRGTISVCVRRSKNEGIFSVSDAGPGIREADSRRLFTRGGKLSARPTAGEHSTGYGLAIAKDLVDALGGRIWFENERTGGATFSFSVPSYDSERVFKSR